MNELINVNINMLGWPKHFLFFIRNILVDLFNKKPGFQIFQILFWNYPTISKLIKIWNWAYFSQASSCTSNKLSSVTKAMKNTTIISNIHKI